METGAGCLSAGREPRPHYRGPTDPSTCSSNAESEESNRDACSFRPRHKTPGCQSPVTAALPVAGGSPGLGEVRRERLSGGASSASAAAAHPRPPAHTIRAGLLPSHSQPAAQAAQHALLRLIFLRTCHQGKQQPLGVLPPTRHHCEMLQQPAASLP